MMYAQSNYKRLINFADDIVQNYNDFIDGRLAIDFDEISDYDKKKLAALLFEEDDRDVNYFINENANSDQLLSSLVRLFTVDTMQAKREFLETLEHNFVTYYEPRMRKLIDERLSEYENNMMYENNMRMYQYPDNGEIHWVR